MKNIHFLPATLVALLFLKVMAASKVMVVSTTPDEDVAEACANEIKEFHFHVYFFQDNTESNKSAEALFNKISNLVAAGFFYTMPLRINRKPRGPHSIGSFEVWCPKEHFSRVYSWFLLNRGPHSVLVHPLTREEIKDHTERVAWMGAPVPLDLSALDPLLDELPKQYPEMALGYSAPTNCP